MVSSSAAAIIFFLLGRDFRDAGKETVAPFSIHFPSFLILARFHTETPVAVDTLEQTLLNVNFIRFHACYYTNWHKL
jgi:hypothetical protein